MTRRSLQRGVRLLCALFLLWPAAVGAQVKYIDITSPAIRKVPIAVPLFKTGSTDAEALRMAREGADLLSAGLDFTGFFKILDREAFLLDPGGNDILPPNIRFHNWTAIGAELLVTAGLTVGGELVEAEFRLFDTFKERMMVGKLYKGRPSDLRRMVHRFCGEILFQLTGSRGVFDSRIAFVSKESGPGEIFTCEFDGYDPKPFTRTGNITLSPAWSSDGQWIAYTAFPQASPGLFIKHLTDGRGYAFTGSGVKLDPAWSPGKFELAATLSHEGDPEIYLLTGTGKIIKRVTQSPGIDVSAAWSPDGTRMAFVSKRAGTPQIYIMDMATRQTTRLTYQGQYHQQPSWSPKGDRIAFTGMEKNRIDIFTIGVDGTGLKQLTFNAGDNESPSWSPDGTLIAFSSTREGPSRVYVMSVHGADQRRLLALPGQQINPEWSPRIVSE